MPNRLVCLHFYILFLAVWVGVCILFACVLSVRSDDAQLPLVVPLPTSGRHHIPGQYENQRGDSVGRVIYQSVYSGLRLTRLFARLAARKA